MNEVQLCWICPRCHNELGILNRICEYCKYEDETIVYNPNKFDIHQLQANHAVRETKKMTDNVTKDNNELDPKEFEAVIDSNPKLTPQEKLFSKLFYHETHLVKDMDTLTLRAHREELAEIAFIARARLTAVDAEEDNRKKKSSSSKPSGFERSVNTDDTTSDAINKIKTRQQKLTKAEKIREGLIKLGIDPDAADKIMSAKNILTQTSSAKLQNTSKQDIPVEEKIPVFNPFNKS